jgi:uncharacterized protein (DUF1330 family)
MQGLSEGTMSAYVFAKVTITDYEKYRASWQVSAQAVHDRVGSKMLVRTDHPEVLAGDDYGGGRIVLLEFEKADKARNWWKQMSELLTADFMTQQHVMILEGVER